MVKCDVSGNATGDPCLQTANTPPQVRSCAGGRRSRKLLLQVIDTTVEIVVNGCRIVSNVLRQHGGLSKLGCEAG
jgi:hypothetical protein